MAFQTGPAFKHVEAVVGESVTVFIPSTPGTITGYTAVIPRQDVIDLPISVDEAIRFAVSGGVLVPDRETSSRGGENAMLPKLSASGRPCPAEPPVAGPVGHPPAGP
jgi:uncharacterized membrane protein